MFGWYDLNIQYRKLIKAKNHELIFPRKNGLIRDFNPEVRILKILTSIDSYQNDKFLLKIIKFVKNPAWKTPWVRKPGNSVENVY